MSEKIRMIKLRPCEGYPWCVVTIADALDILKDASPNENYEVFTVDMTQEQIEALPEFEGW